MMQIRPTEFDPIGLLYTVYASRRINPPNIQTVNGVTRTSKRKEIKCLNGHTIKISSFFSTSMLVYFVELYDMILNSLHCK